MCIRDSHTAARAACLLHSVDEPYAHFGVAHMDVSVRTVFQRLVELADELCMAGAVIELGARKARVLTQLLAGTCLLYTSRCVSETAQEQIGFSV